VITQAELGGLVANIFDRLLDEHPGCEIQDGMVLVELHDPKEPEVTLVMIECSSDRLTIRSGMLEFGQKSLWSQENSE